LLQQLILWRSVSAVQGQELQATWLDTTVRLAVLQALLQAVVVVVHNKAPMDATAVAVAVAETV
jgi:hypothetical protein